MKSALFCLLFAIGCGQSAPPTRYQLVASGPLLIVLDQVTADTWMLDGKHRRWVRLPNPSVGPQIVSSAGGLVEFPAGMSAVDMAAALASDVNTNSAAQ